MDENERAPKSIMDAGKFSNSFILIFVTYKFFIVPKFNLRRKDLVYVGTLCTYITKSDKYAIGNK